MQGESEPENTLASFKCAEWGSGPRQCIPLGFGFGFGFFDGSVDLRSLEMTSIWSRSKENSSVFIIGNYLTMKVVIVGATGETGQAIVKGLQESPTQFVSVHMSSSLDPTFTFM